ncbi:Maph10 [Matsumuraeses phaseoli granulovirus]|uniref:Maph10 n=1 Tax=Matsumuraeses phaseoli granulovirus TaxID=2760664 RepID=A0AAE7MLD0_9BBAC|nr:Maph10 [Matsumuraeses phaseoli granulovirus]QOD39973.1 Maph10 [Matsumuraeses phaseoli granulovirus]
MNNNNNSSNVFIDGDTFYNGKLDVLFMDMIKKIDYQKNGNELYVVVMVWVVVIFLKNAIKHLYKKRQKTATPGNFRNTNTTDNC